jgi:hypothetical protein
MDLSKRKILTNKVDPVLSFAASELQRYVKLLSGKKWVINGLAMPHEGNIVLTIVNDVDACRLPDKVKEMCSRIRNDGFVSGEFKGTVYIIAKETRGVLYGVYDLLESEAGIVFGGPNQGEEYIPALKTFAVRKKISLQNPTLAHRFIGFHIMEEFSAWVPMMDWMSKRKFNGMQIFIPVYLQNRDKLLQDIKKRGMQIDAGGHSAFEFLNPDTYLKSHPGYYSKNHKGRVTAKQLCYSNQAMRREYAGNILLFLKNYPEISIISLWPQDGLGECQCRACQKNSVNKSLIETIIYVAELVAAEFPKVMVCHLAYLNYVNVPSGIKKLPENVLIHFCDYWDRTINKPIFDYRQGAATLHDETDVKESAKLGCEFRNHRNICEQLAQWRMVANHPTVFSYYSDLVMKKKLLTNVAAAIKKDMIYYKALGIEGYTDCCPFPQLWMALAWNAFALAEFSWNSEGNYQNTLFRFTRGVIGKGTEKITAKFYRLLAELQNEPSLLGFNTLDLLHRNSRETAYFAGVIPELVEPTRKAFSRLFSEMRGLLSQLSKIKGAHKNNAHTLEKMVTQVETELENQFSLYLSLLCGGKKKEHREH